MKPYILILLLTVTLVSAGHAASEYTITDKHRVIEEATLDENNVPVGTKLPALSFTTLDGKTHNVEILTKQGPIVFVFLATECPVAQRYTTRLKRFHAEFPTYTFVAVYPNENDSVDEVKAYVAKAAYPFHVVKDATGRLARLFDATMTPQAFLLDTTRTLQYRGAIDDNRYETRVKHHYLRDVLIATRDGVPVPVQTTSAFGCTIHFPETALPDEVTYSEHIAPILQSSARRVIVKAKLHPSPSRTIAMQKRGQRRSRYTHKHGSCPRGNPPPAMAISKTNAGSLIPTLR